MRRNRVRPGSSGLDGSTYRKSRPMPSQVPRFVRPLPAIRVVQSMPIWYHFDPLFFPPYLNIGAAWHSLTVSLFHWMTTGALEPIAPISFALLIHHIRLFLRVRDERNFCQASLQVQLTHSIAILGIIL